MQDDRTPRVLIVDDIAENRRALATILSDHGGYDIQLAATGAAVTTLAEEQKPDLILLDVRMPEMNGYEVATALKGQAWSRAIPIIFITAATDTDSVVRAFQSGGVDYVSKPFNPAELLARVEAHLQLKLLRDKLHQKNRILENRKAYLERLVGEKTRKLEDISLALVSALESANYLNDTDTGDHLKRVSEYAALLAKAYGCDRGFVKRIRLYASLHDVGKVGIPDALLKKEGRYTPGEFVQMQEHVSIGARILTSDSIDTLARNVAQYHHEKWDGSGYQQGLAGEQIPLEARLVAVADVYDALTSRRSYKEACSQEQAFSMIKEQSGRHFDPAIVEAFIASWEAIRRIRSILSG